MNSLQKHCLMSVLMIVGLVSANGVNTVNAEARSLAGPMGSTFRIRSQSTRGNIVTTGHGTTFGVNLSEYGYNKPRYLMTACHVIVERNGMVSPTLQVEIRRNGTARWVACRVISKDAKLDVALLECEVDLPHTSRFAAQETPKGGALVTIGSPGGVPLRSFRGRVSQIKRSDPSVAYVDYIQEGCSGGPVFDSASQRIMGLVIAGIAIGDSRHMDPHTCLYVSLPNIQRFVRASVRYAGGGYADRRNSPQPTSSSDAVNEYSMPRRNSEYASRNADRSGVWIP